MSGDPGDTALVPATASTDWRNRAACRGHDPELFFPAGATGPGRDQTDRAMAVCARCPVRAACLDFALAAIPHGIAGGRTAAEREALRRAGHHSSYAFSSAADRDIELGVAVTCQTPAERRAAGVAALRAGYPAKTVATTYGVTSRTVARWAGQLRATSLAQAG